MRDGARSDAWLPASPSKRWCELFFLKYSVVWVSCVALVVVFQLYEEFGKWGYLWFGVAIGGPCFLLPFLLRPKADQEKPFWQRYWVKANAWIAVFSFVGNYFWTHYFYQVLGASYTMQTWDLNQVPICMFFLTHAYFCLYHTLSNILIRKAQPPISLCCLMRTVHQVRASLKGFGPRGQSLGEAVAVFLFAYFAAFMETLTIQEYPYYTFVDRRPMYTVGALFYAIYFFVSFPVFFRMDEDPSVKWSLGEAVFSSLAAGMLVTIFLDLWRLALGPLVDIDPEHKAHGPPWLMATRNSRYP